jgi:aspartyl-tRNA(Asn)/glutamyl-tRNA(Gln) amidotransferase subunit A
MVPMSTGSDGGGSIRIPASFSGLLGFKASFGRIPMDSVDTGQTAVVGALTTCVGDAARHLDVACGPDSRDRTSLPHPGVSYEQVIETLDVQGLRVAWTSDLGFAAVDPEVVAICEAAATTLIKEAHLTRTDYQASFSDPTEVWARAGAIDIWLNLERDEWPAAGELLVPPVRKSFELTENLKPSDYVRTMRARTKLEYEVAEMFDEIDILLSPATAVPAFKAEGPPPTEIDGRTVHSGASVPFTMLGNLAWNPAVSVPAGMTRGQLPIGLQIMGKRHCDDVVLRLARILERANPWPAVAPGWAGSP